ncbi:MAG: NAD(P)-dependent oxidoreductase [Pseudomonadota bacterium]
MPADPVDDSHSVAVASAPVTGAGDSARTAPVRRVLLYGATGFIGRQLQADLLAAGYQVRAMVRPESRHRALLDDRIERIDARLDDHSALRRALTEVDAVIYGAGAVRGSSLGDFLPANVGGLAVLTEVLETFPQIPLLLLSSLAASRRDISWYATSKAAGEDMVRQHRKLAWTILRPPAVYGPHDLELMPLFRIARAGVLPRVASGEQRLSFIHVEDLAAAVVAWLEHEPALRHQVFSIDDGHIDGYDWHQIAGSVMESRERGWARHAFVMPLPHALLKVTARINLWLARLTDRAPMLTPGKVRELRAPHWIGDNTEFTRLTGWQPRLGLAQGIRKTLDGSATAPVLATPELS